MDLDTHRVERLQKDASARTEGVVFGVPAEEHVRSSR
jgi:hypothetical protein